MAAVAELRRESALFWVHALGFHLRLLAQNQWQHRVKPALQERTRRQGKPTKEVDGRPAQRDGSTIAAELAGAAKLWERKGWPEVPAWVRADTLAKAIDALEGRINLGGSGGPNRGKPPEAWAAKIAAEISRKLAVRN